MNQGIKDYKNSNFKEKTNSNIPRNYDHGKMFYPLYY